MNAVVKLQQAPKIEGDGLSHEEFMALSGLAPIPPIPFSSRPLPVVFDVAVKAIAACQTIDEAKNWSTKADALAAWAKIYADDDVSREARALKLHAYRRMAVLAEQLRPQKNLGKGKGTTKGPHSLLVECGLSDLHASQARSVAKIPDQQFRGYVNSENPPTPAYLLRKGWTRNEQWMNCRRAIGQCYACLNREDFPEIAKSLDGGERNAALALIEKLGVILSAAAIELRR